MTVRLDEVVTGLGLLGNLLSIPRQVESQQTENEQLRALLTGTGVPQEQINAATPEPAMRWLSPKQGGFTGKVLGGVGDVGSILSTVVGKPVKAPRMDLSEMAAATTMRSAFAKSQAQQRLQDAIARGASNKEIGELAVAAGSIEGGLRFLRADDYKTPGSIFAARERLSRMAPDDPNRPALERLIEQDKAEWDRRQQEQDRLLRERQPPHYTPEETEQRRHAQIMKQRDEEAQARHYTPGSPEYKYYMDFGHDRPERAPKAGKTLDDYIEDERRRRDRWKPGDPNPPNPNDPIEDAARRNMAAAEEAKRRAATGEKPPPPPPPPEPRPGTPAYERKKLEEGLGAGMRARPSEAATGTTTTTTPSTTTTSTTENPDAEVDAYLRSINLDTLPPAVREQVKAAAAAGMPKWPLANWLRSLQ